MQSSISRAEECLARVFAGNATGVFKFAPFVETEPELLAPVFIELGCGHRVAFALMGCAIIETYEDANWQPWEYSAISVYVAGDHYDNRLRKCFELREGIEFQRANVADHWLWLEELAASRQVLDFDDVDDLLDCFCDHIAQNFEVEDMVCHCHRLPGLYIPSVFDQWDDSFSNDEEKLYDRDPAYSS
jgi:hypothetical protein